MDKLDILILLQNVVKKMDKETFLKVCEMIYDIVTKKDIE